MYFNKQVSKYSNVVYTRQFTGSGLQWLWGSRTVVLGSASRKVRLGAEVVVAACLPGLIDRRPPLGGTYAEWDDGSLGQLSELVTYMVSNRVESTTI